MKKLIITVLLAIFSFNVFAQQQTVYEKKNFELLSQIKKKWGNKAVEQVNASVEGVGYNKFLREVAVLETLYSMERAAGNKKYAESATKGLEIEAIFWYAKEWGKINKLITNFDDIKMSIKKEFKKWNKKGEFEKQTDYKERLKNESENSFANICIQQIKKGIDNIYLSEELLPYDSEKENFSIGFKYNRLNSPSALKWQSVLKIPITDAENFKNNFSDFRVQKYYYEFNLYEGWLIPTIVTLFRTDNHSGNAKIIEKYDVYVKLQNQTEITVPFDGLGIENEYLNGYVFKYSNTKAIAEQQEREKQRLDSLELATFNNQLDSIFIDYNRQLLQNPYNLKQTVLKNYDKISAADTNNRQYSFDRQVSSMKSEFEGLKSNFEYDYRNEYRQNGKLFASESEFDSFYTKGNELYWIEIEKRKIEIEKRKEEAEKIENLNYLSLSENKEIIRLINFKQLKSPYYLSEINKYANAGSPNIVRMKLILTLLDELKNKSYYPQAIDILVENNKALSKEWGKNGKYFENKADFYENYISENYKEILNANKKKK